MARTGYLIEGGKIVSVKGEDKALERARSDDYDNGCHVFWTKEGAEAELHRQTDPVGASYKDFAEGRITLDDFRSTVGFEAAEKHMEKHG